MTINELIVYVLERAFELLERIVLAFARTFNLVAEGRLGSLVLSDLGIIVVVTVVVLCALLACLVGLVEDWRARRDRREDRRDDD